MHEDLLKIKMLVDKFFDDHIEECRSIECADPVDHRKTLLLESEVLSLSGAVDDAIYIYEASGYEG